MEVEKLGSISIPWCLYVSELFVVKIMIPFNSKIWNFFKIVTCGSFLIHLFNCVKSA